MARNSGKKSEAIFEDNVSGLVFRLRDKADLVGLNKGKNVAAFGNPSDYIIVELDRAYLAEVKSTTSTTSFSLSGFTPAQRSAMYKMHKSGMGHHYLVYIHSLHHDTWHLITADEYVETIKSGKKSIKWKDLTTQISW